MKNYKLGLLIGLIGLIVLSFILTSGAYWVVCWILSLFDVMWEFKWLHAFAIWILLFIFNLFFKTEHKG